ncbi:flagellar motor switch phosphatase FliY [Marinilactibacillus psychrotolerans]|uniref:Flagellar motor switch phosphatase FliY n=1 Tax=Marinilactibacillus psychrotolerans TaxID=191770 RepID=A0A511H1H4_9LACT|nr:flagellar motor switch phosphatase FliY [Marinilactibacillus psychrotolerans]TLQ09373.1 flagellar motor switch phosphatase FliY [Marinilactibacillus psychrotolerans]GEL67376.1 flagellar motor switch phosphatase FliY [Marinilactibacillus psychrotolerans]GEQ36319.1 flagellar motor switching and energizing phosphatase [Marinilactibacillus psychrotolerans]SDC95179.1 flagellar motor switch protein FliN/FliY [Marinilactibacillus psychrotolerans]
MSSGQLSQEEIDAMLNGTGPATTTEEESVTETIDPDDQVSQNIKDILGEVGNISMSQAATTLSQLLNRTIKITTPKVSGVTLKQILDECEVPKVVTTIGFKEGLVGNNILMIDVEDAIIIADLMMGNDGKNVEGKEFTELELSAVAEAMNQMMGSASTAMATMFNKKIDILPPEVEMWNSPEEATIENITDKNLICKTSFHLSVEGLLESEIMQILPMETANEIVDIMLGDEAEVLQGRDTDDTEKVSASEQRQETEAKPTTKKAPEPEPVSVQKPQFQELEPNGMKSAPRNLDLIMDVPLDFSVVLGKSKKTIRDILSLGTGSVVELDKMTDEPLEIYVNGKLIAEGEVVVINESFGIRITNILSKEQRISHLK